MADPSAADTMRERAGASDLAFWLLVEANRWLVAGLVLAAVFGALVAVGAAVPGAAGRLAAGDPVETLFQALVGATVTGVTLVVTLNQLVLSQELGPAGEQRDRMEGTGSFRSDVAEAVGTPVSPPEPAAFLQSLVEAAGDAAERLRASVDGAGGEFRERADDLADDVTGNAGTVAADLDGAQFGTFAVVSAALDFDYAWKLYAARQLRAEFDGEMGAEADAALADLVEVLELFGPAREHVKTLWVRWALVDLSRAVLWTSLPALVVSVGTLVFLAPGRLAGSVAGVPLSVLALGAATALSLLPFAVLLAYVLRIATVAKRTLSIGAFTLRETDRREE